MNATPIRVVSNNRSGATVRSVAKLGGIYHAYFTYASGGTTYEATSSDGMNFSADIPVGVPAGYDLLATTTVTVAGQEQILSVWDSGGNEYYSLSSDGSNFTMADSIALPSNFGISNILVENGQLEMFGPAGAGNVNWPYGNTVIQYATATLNLDNIPEPATNMVFAVCLGGLAVLRMWRRVTTSSTRSAVPT